MSNVQTNDFKKWETKVVMGTSIGAAMEVAKTLLLLEGIVCLPLLPLDELIEKKLLNVGPPAQQWKGVIEDKIIFLGCKPDASWGNHACRRTNCETDKEGSLLSKLIDELCQMKIATVIPYLSDATKRWIDLVVANSVGGIEFMEKLFATSKEILSVLAYDRKAIGITEADEIEADTALSLNDYNNTRSIRIIRTNCEYSRAITDKLYFLKKKSQFLIISNDYACFFGTKENADLIEAKFRGLVYPEGSGGLYKWVVQSDTDCSNKLISFVREMK